MRQGTENERATQKKSFRNLYGGPLKSLTEYSAEHRQMSKAWQRTAIKETGAAQIPKVSSTVRHRQSNQPHC